MEPGVWCVPRCAPRCAPAEGEPTQRESAVACSGLTLSLSLLVPGLRAAGPGRRERAGVGPWDGTQLLWPLGAPGWAGLLTRWL